MEGKKSHNYLLNLVIKLKRGRYVTFILLKVYNLQFTTCILQSLLITELVYFLLLKLTSFI